MISLLAAAAIVAAPSISDFFPLAVGTTWEYAEQGMIIRDRVAPMEDVAGAPAVPVVSEIQGKEDHRTYYRVEGDTAYIVAFDPKKPLGMPIPVLKVGAGRTKWEFTGQSMLYNEPVPQSMTAESAPKGKRKVLDRELEVIEVKMKGMLGSNPGTAIKVNQVAYYAKGIGLVEMLSENTIGSQRSKSQLKLVKFEAPKLD